MARILLVEDEKNASLLYSMELEADGHQVIPAYDSDDALRALKEDVPDLVVLDIRLDGKMNGIELMSTMLSENGSLPVIINTGYSQYRNNFMTWGAEAYVIKSANLTPLKEAISDVLDKRRQREPGAGREASSGA